MIMVSVAMTAVSLVRTSDAWPFLEKTAAMVHATFARSEERKNECEWRLILPKHSPWNQSSALRPLPTSSVLTQSPRAVIELSFDPVKVNVSPELCVLLLDWISFAIGPPTKDLRKTSKGSSGGFKQDIVNVRLRLELPSFEIKLMEESQTQGGMSVADPKASLSQSSCFVNVDWAMDKLSIEFQVGGFSVRDLSSLPGILMIGQKTDSNFMEAKANIVMPSAEYESSLEIGLDVTLGNLYFLVLPTFVQSLVSFESRLRAHRYGKLFSTAQSTTKRSRTEQHVTPCVDFRFAVAGLEFIVSSRQLFDYIRDRSEESIDVVTFRLAFSVVGALVPSSARAKKASHGLVTASQLSSSEVPKILTKFLQTHGRNFPISSSDESALAFLCDLSVSNFQALRTSIRQSDPSSGESNPHRFFTQPPARGEQRITNTINIILKYRAAGIRWRESMFPEVKSNFAQSLQMESDLVDILAYVNQSERGLNKAYTISVEPILDALRGSRLKLEGPRSPKVGGSDNLMLNCLMATTVCSVTLRGIKITCVPGGATRLTESPIIKATAKNFRLGLAALQVPTESTSLSRTSGTESNLTIGMWIASEVSANYHNRRLVAWEPVLEPWDLAIRFGADLVRLFGVPTTTIQHIEVDSGTSSRLPLLPDALQERAGETLRDFGRLLRSPFYGGTISKTPDQPPGSAVLDLAFFLLVIFDQSSVTPALFSNYERSVHLRRNVPENPHDDPLVWLEQFGFPSIEKKRASRRPPLLVSVSDKKAMNINLTGALIENMGAYFGKERLSSGVPHMIRNNTGVTIRFSEVLDQDRRQRSEKASKVTLGNGKEIPLSLRRSRSQSCDPHRGFIRVEMGRLLETGPQRHTSFLYELVGNLAVDTVGVETMVVREKKNHAVGVGVVIVRVMLRGGVKIVSLESPMLIQNISNVNLVFEVREGPRHIWTSKHPDSEDLKESQSQVPFAVPFHVVKKLDDKTGILLAKSPLANEDDPDTQHGSWIAPPPPFTHKSVSEGIVVEEEVFIHKRMTDSLSPFAVNVCGLRVGAEAMKEDGGRRGGRSGEPEGRTKVPEQRMVLIRPPLMFKNFLPVPLHLLVRVKRVVKMLSTISSTNLMGITGFASGSRERARTPIHQDPDEWVDLGILDPCKAVSWTGAGCEDKIEVKIKLFETTREASRQFPEWSTTLVLASCQNLRKQKDRIETNIASAKLKLKDKDGISLSISVSVQGSLKEPSQFDNIRDCTGSISPAPMMVEFVVPFWIVDTTGKELEFVSEQKIAGQRDRVGEDTDANSSIFIEEATGKQKSALRFALGLGELTETDSFRDFKDDSLRICMLGDAKASTLSIRRNIARTAEDDSNRRYLSSWCEPILLRHTKVDTDVYVSIPHRFGGRSKHRLVADRMEPLALHAKVAEAPKEIGGSLTRIIHIFNRYEVVNNLGRDIEILADQNHSIARTVPSDGHPIPYHFDDSNPIRFRPKEFGWKWSGLIFVKRKRREVTTRLVHRMKGWTVIVTIEFFSSGRSPGTVLVFRPASKPPFRLENHTMHPLCFGQTSMVVQRGDTMDFSLESVLLPFHKVDYAYEEPDEAGKSVLLDLADARYSGIFGPSTRLGKFALERTAPGSTVTMWNSNFWGKVKADGPIRVLQIYDSKIKPLSTPDDKGSASTSFTRSVQPSETPSMVEVRLSHGIGVSVVDWVPQELMYLRFGELFLERTVGDQLEKFVCSIPHVSIDNQLWITPYPVLLRMGKSVRQRTMERRRRRRNEAVHISWRRRLTQEGELTIFEQFDVAVEPIAVRADGYLFELGMRMLNEAAGRGYAASSSADPHSGSAASLLNQWRRSSGQLDPQGDAGSNGNALVRAHSDGMDKLFPLDSDLDLGEQKLPAGTFDVARNKFYIDRFKISTIAAEVSWTGPLPIAFSNLPDMLRPALTFEALPVRLRPFTSQNWYGSVQDISDRLKLHYMSFWRVLDILSGLPLRPMFIIRACFYTWRESLSSVLDKISKKFTTLEKGLLVWSPQELLPASSSEDSALSTMGFTWFYRLTVGKTALTTATWSRAWANGFGRIATLLRYDGGKVSGDALAVRSREPRLFAHVDGKELLVDYVEGKNAGKALLSRVRRGQHLGEGYVYHIDSVYERLPTGETQFASRSLSPLILIATSERLLLLHGQRDNRFCSVVWESALTNLVELESEEAESEAYLKIWYMGDGTIAGHKHSNRIMETATDDKEHGLGLLLCKTLLTPVGASGGLGVALDKVRVIGGLQK